MSGSFIYLQKHRIARSVFWQKSLIINIILGLFLLLILVEIMFVGFFLGKILTKAEAGVPTWQVLNSGLIYYFFATFMIRFFVQDLPAMEITPLLHLPVTKSRISLFLNYRSLLSFFNFLPFFLFLPFSINYLPAYFSHLSAFVWFAAVFLFEMTSNFLIIRIKRKSIIKPSVVLIVLGIAVVLVLLEKYDIFSLSIISSRYFGGILSNPIFILLPLVTTGFFFWENFRYTKKHCYLSDLSRKKKQTEKFRGHLLILENQGEIGALILNEVRLLFRNKRSKQMVAFTLPIMLLYGLLFYPDLKNLNHNVLLGFVGLFISGGFLITYGQYILAWESSHFDFILTSNIQTEQFFRAKYYLMIIPTLLLFLITVPYVYFGIKILIINFVMLTFNIGINAPFLLFAASFNRKRMELDRGQMMNYQGIGINNFLIVIPLFFIPVLINWFFNHFVGYRVSLLIMFGIGLTGIIFYRQLIRFAALFYKNNRYKIAMGFRSS